MEVKPGPQSHFSRRAGSEERIVSDLVVDGGPAVAVDPLLPDDRAGEGPPAKTKADPDRAGAVGGEIDRGNLPEQEEKRCVEQSCGHRELPP
jgi:hypothetical protein